MIGYSMIWDDLIFFFCDQRQPPPLLPKRKTQPIGKKNNNISTQMKVFLLVMWVMSCPNVSVFSHWVPPCRFLVHVDMGCT